MKELEGKLFDMKVKVSPYVDEDSVYLINPKNISIIKNMESFKPYRFRDKLKNYFKNLWKAIRGKA